VKSLLKGVAHWSQIFSFLLFSFCLPSFGFSGEVSRQKLVYPIRALHIDLHGITVKKALSLVEMAHDKGFNAVILLIGYNDNGVKLNSYPVVTMKRWSRDSLFLLASRAKKLGLVVIPGVPLLTHQEILFRGSHPEMMFNRETYDPRNKQVYKIVFGILDEVIELLNPPAIHIGHDEVLKKISVRHRPKWMKAEIVETMLPADLFLQDVVSIHNYLKQRGLETLMWGDMLLSSDEFPMVKKYDACNGDDPGYGKELRRKIPKDIIINDWHYSRYSEYPSIDVFKAEGFRVLGATFDNRAGIRNFSAYAKKHGADGMIATTWFYVQRKQWDVVDGIISYSGERFREDFGD